MSYTWKNGYTGQPGIVVETLYTCPANTTARVLKAIAVNDSTAEELTLYKVASGDAAGDDNLVLNAKAIGEDESYEIYQLEGQVVEAGATIQGFAGAADQITVIIDVVELV